MLTGTLHTWVKRHIAVRQRLERVCTSYVLFLMVATTKHSLKEAARFSGLHPSLFAKLLQSHAQVAITTLESLSKTQARQFAKTLARVKGLPWKIVIIIDSTLQHRAMNSRIAANMSAWWPTCARSTWKTTLARTIGVRCWC